jgi:ribosome-binding ATPase YchF (GTP1/OBG family)
MREVDAITLVLRDFDGDANPLRELNELLTEMILADLTVVENRRSRLKKEKARPLEEALLERCAAALENQESLRFFGVQCRRRKSRLGLWLLEPQAAASDL